MALLGHFWNFMTFYYFLTSGTPVNVSNMFNKFAAAVSYFIVPEVRNLNFLFSWGIKRQYWPEMGLMYCRCGISQPLHVDTKTNGFVGNVTHRIQWKNCPSLKVFKKLNAELSMNLPKSSLWKMFFKIGVAKNFANFRGKHLCWSLLLIKLLARLKNSLQHRCFPVKFEKFLKTLFFYKKPPVAASVLLLVRLMQFNSGLSIWVMKQKTTGAWTWLLN